METKHVSITVKPDETGCCAIDRKELSECFNKLIGLTARSVPDSDIDAAYDEAFMEYKRS